MYTGPKSAIDTKQGPTRFHEKGLILIEYGIEPFEKPTSKQLEKHQLRIQRRFVVSKFVENIAKRVTPFPPKQKIF